MNIVVSTQIAWFSKISRICNIRYEKQYFNLHNSIIQKFNVIFKKYILEGIQSKYQKYRLYKYACKLRLLFQGFDNYDFLKFQGKNGSDATRDALRVLSKPILNAIQNDIILLLEGK